MTEELSQIRVETKYGNGVIAHSNETHYWVFLDEPLRFSDQLLNSIPVKKSEAKIIESRSSRSHTREIDEDFVGYI